MFLALGFWNSVSRKRLTKYFIRKKCTHLANCNLTLPLTVNLDKPLPVTLLAFKSSFNQTLSQLAFVCLLFFNNSYKSKDTPKTSSSVYKEVVGRGGWQVRADGGMGVGRVVDWFLS